MKKISSQMKNHLKNEVTSLATCWELIRKDNQKFFFTDHDSSIFYQGKMFSASSGYNRTAIQNSQSFAVDNLDITGIFDSELITEEDMRAGLFDHAEIKIFVVNWANLLMGDIKLRRGFLGEVSLTEQGIFQAELRGITQPLSQRIGQIYKPECRVDLGGTACMVRLYSDDIQREYDYKTGDFVRISNTPNEQKKLIDSYGDLVYKCTTPGRTAKVQPVYGQIAASSEIVDGTAKFEARAAWARAGRTVDVQDSQHIIADISEPRAQAAGWFDGGYMVWETGSNAGRLAEIKSFDNTTGGIVFFLPQPFEPKINDIFRIFPGCDKRLKTCHKKFENAINFRGDPFVPGQDQLTFYPDSKSG